ncbi:MAG TPA: hypothetical protein VGI99_04285, partial [Gemmataceae bacterium]
MSSNFFDRQRAALVRLTEAIAGRSAAEAELATAFQTASEKAEREINRARKTIGNAREAELSKLLAAHEAAATEIAERHRTALLGINRSRDEKRTTTVQRYKAAEERGQSEYKDRLWSHESIFEGGDKKARDQMEMLQRKAAAGNEQIEGQWLASDAPLARCGVNRDDIEFHEVPAMPDDDPISGMQKAIAASTTSLGQLRGLFLPKLANLGGLMLFILLFAGLGASGFAFLDPAPAAAIAAGAGVILGGAAWMSGKVQGSKQTLRVGAVLGEHLASAAAACERLRTFAAREYEEVHEQITDKLARKRKEAEQHYLPEFARQKEQYEAGLAKLVAEHEASTAAEMTRHERERDGEETGYEQSRSDAETRCDGELKAAEATYAGKIAAATAARDDAWNKLTSAWEAATT